tara:strand:- start:88307 stop:89104 length:798 start_codon:yes stop_codon:yes gene_type:complete
MRLFLISLGTVVIALLIGLIVRMWGLSLPYKPFEHPFLSSAMTTNRPITVGVFSKDHVRPDSKPTLTWINVYMTADRVLISDYNFNVDAFMTWARDKKKFKGKFVHGYKLAELNEFYENITPLEKALQVITTDHYILNILSNETDIHKDVISFVEKNKLEDRILINSPVDIVIKAIKELKPMWVYGTSIPEVTRLKSFATLGLEAAISIRGDVFIAPISYLNRPLVDESMITEMRRRKKLVFLGPIQSEAEMKLADELKPDGVIF